MPWLIGVDEAGYGPNLGPLVMTGVALRVPESLVGVDLWSVLSGAVRRQADIDAGQLVIDDSKAVYGGRGLAALEAGVLAALVPGPPPCLADYLHQMAAGSLEDLAAEPWHQPEQVRGQALPLEADAVLVAEHADRWRQGCAGAGVAGGAVCSVLLQPRRFNAVVERAGSKGAALAWCLTRIVRHLLAALPEGEPALVHVDKHGGRNTYSAMLQEAVEEGMVLAQQESNLRSVYNVVGGPRELRFTFEPRADSAHLPVALASMASKYLREVLMAGFNRYWTGLVPGLRPTAGYPADAQRFLDGIRPVLEQRKLPLDDVWRRR